ncbi:hypothetical protein Syun_019599 [Stephania yunnanensis]|uniref:Uncharacterized protein n=1 Tax=Stephania yunnanensis TaxID=152371 RepID=A0AAP0IWE5_9MAGN
MCELIRVCSLSTHFSINLLRLGQHSSSAQFLNQIIIRHSIRTTPLLAHPPKNLDSVLKHSLRAIPIRQNVKGPEIHRDPPRRTMLIHRPIEQPHRLLKLPILTQCIQHRIIRHRPHLHPRSLPNSLLIPRHRLPLHTLQEIRLHNRTVHNAILHKPPNLSFNSSNRPKTPSKSPLFTIPNIK